MALNAGRCVSLRLPPGVLVSGRSAAAGSARIRPPEAAEPPQQSRRATRCQSMGGLEPCPACPLPSQRGFSQVTEQAEERWGGGGEAGLGAGTTASCGAAALACLADRGYTDATRHTQAV